jgi:cell division septal protein FtsQ
VVSRRHVYKENFIRGLFFSVGGVIGATVGVGIIAWTLSLFNQVPLVGKFTRSVEQTINENK